jgi:hypothetical protein
MHGDLAGVGPSTQRNFVQVERHELARDGDLSVVVGRHGYALSRVQPQWIGRVDAIAWQRRRLARDREGPLGIDIGALAVPDRADALLPTQQVLERREELTERRQKTVTHPDRVPRRRISQAGLIAEPGERPSEAVRRSTRAAIAL